jgi:hypothetical protein
MSRCKWWVKERHNPQFDSPYYTKCGQLTKKRSKRMEESCYGFNIMHSFDTEQESEDFIREKSNQKEASC